MKIAEARNLRERYLTDTGIQFLIKQKARIMMSVPKFVIEKSDEIEIVYEEDVQQLLKEIDKEINSYIKTYYPELSK